MPLLMFDILNNGVVRVVLMGTLLLGIASGALGVFTLLKKQALIGDAVSHSTLPGVVLMFVFTLSKDVSTLLIGAAISAAVSMLLMTFIKKFSKVQNDAILALVLSSFFGFGRFLISLVSRNPEFSKAKLDDFIFGSAATIIERDVVTLVIVAMIVLVIITVIWKRLKLQIFNDEFYKSLGFSSILIEFLMSFMTILVIVIGIRTVGVILMSALLITPGLAARQWSDKLSINVLMSSLFGALAALLGTLYSVTYEGGMPTGPVIVIVGTLIAITSILFAPKKGIIAKEIKRINHRKNILKYKEIIHMYENKTLSVTDKNKMNIFFNERLLEFQEDKIVLTQLGIEKVESIMGGK